MWNNYTWKKGMTFQIDTSKVINDADNKVHGDTAGECAHCWGEEQLDENQRWSLVLIIGQHFQWTSAGEASPFRLQVWKFKNNVKLLYSIFRALCERIILESAY